MLYSINRFHKCNNFIPSALPIFPHSDTASLLPVPQLYFNIEKGEKGRDKLVLL